MLPAMLSMGVFFSIVILGLARRLPVVLLQGLRAAGVPSGAAVAVSRLPPTAALFAAFLGYNPMGHLLPASVLRGLSATARSHLLSLHFFPQLIAPAFMAGLRAAFTIAIALSVVAAVASLLRGQRYIHGTPGGGAVLDPGPTPAGDVPAGSLDPALAGTPVRNRRRRRR